jgi:folate-dependent phosphoribosylglycinamide formyltransferase PurN
MPVFDADRPPRVVALFSGGASGVRYLLEHDPNCGERYEVVGAFTDDPSAPGVNALEARGVDVEAHDIRAFYEARGADTGDMDVRAAFDAETVDRIERFDADVVLLSGYMWLLTDPMVEAYPVLNVHPADLTVTDDDGERVYVGHDPVYDAVTDGRAETRSTVHFVTPGVDEGPLLVRSRPFPVNQEQVATLQAHGGEAALRQYADAHQEWMKWDGDGPALATALRLVADGAVQFAGGGGLLVDGEPGPYDLPE